MQKAGERIVGVPSTLPLQDLTGVLSLAASDKGFAPDPLGTNSPQRARHKTSFYNTIGGQGQTLCETLCEAL